MLTHRGQDTSKRGCSRTVRTHACSHAARVAHERWWVYARMHATAASKPAALNCMAVHAHVLQG
eukprot:8681634-Alexandrium_andersonii.AAC.1